MKKKISVDFQLCISVPLNACASSTNTKAVMLGRSLIKLVKKMIVVYYLYHIKKGLKQN